MKMIERGDFLFEEVASDRLSSKMRKVRGKISSSKDFKDLVAKGQVIADTVTYLSENMRPLEQDQLGGQILLRSVEPDQIKNRIEYFEMVLKQSGDLELQRYSYSKDSQERSPSDFILSHDLIERLATDLNQL